MSNATPTDEPLELLTERYRAGTAPERLTAAVVDAVERPQPASPRLPAALAAAVLAAVALVIALPVSEPGQDDAASPRWRVSASTPERPAAVEAPAPMRVALSLTTPRRPAPAADDPDATPPAETG